MLEFLFDEKGCRRSHHSIFRTEVSFSSLRPHHGCHIIDSTVRIRSAQVNRFIKSDPILLNRFMSPEFSNLLHPSLTQRFSFHRSQSIIILYTNNKTMASAFHAPFVTKASLESLDLKAGSPTSSMMEQDEMMEIKSKEPEETRDMSETEDEEVKMNCIGGVQAYMTTSDEDDFEDDDAESCCSDENSEEDDE
jgi:hypothetical protein